MGHYPSSDLALLRSARQRLPEGEKVSAASSYPPLLDVGVWQRGLGGPYLLPLWEKVNAPELVEGEVG